MLTHIPGKRIAVPLVLGLALIGAGCGGNDQLANDSAMARDLEMPSRGAAAPTLSDVPPATGSSPSQRPTARTTPATPPVNPPVTPTRGMGTIASGTIIPLESSVRVCTNTHKVADTFTAKTTESIIGTNGVVIPAGATATVQVTKVKRSGNATEKPELGILVQSIMINGKRYAIDGDVSSAQIIGVREGGSGDAKKVIGGAVAGAILGQIIGKDTKSTVIGAATGAAAGTVIAVTTGDKDGCIPEAGKIAVTLNQAVILTS